MSYATPSSEPEKKQQIAYTMNVKVNNEAVTELLIIDFLIFTFVFGQRAQGNILGVFHSLSAQQPCEVSQEIVSGLHG